MKIRAPSGFARTTRSFACPPAAIRIRTARPAGMTPRAGTRLPHSTCSGSEYGTVRRSSRKPRAGLSPYHLCWYHSARMNARPHRVCACTCAPLAVDGRSGPISESSPMPAAQSTCAGDGSASRVITHVPARTE